MLGTPDYDRRRRAEHPWRAWYGTPHWKATRRRQLQEHPLCQMCMEQGIVTAATVCDHAERHNGDPVKFWAGPFKSLCKPHHDATKQREEVRGYRGTVAADGWPIDPRHPANR